MDNKFNNMLQEFLKNNNVENIDEANVKLQEFTKMYNNGEIEYLDRAERFALTWAILVFILTKVLTKRHKRVPRQS